MIMKKTILSTMAVIVFASCETIENPETISETFAFAGIEYLEERISVEYVVENIEPVTFYNKSGIEQEYIYDSHNYTREWLLFQSDDPRAFDLSEEGLKVRVPSEASETGTIFYEAGASWDYMPGVQQWESFGGSATTFVVKPYNKIVSFASFRYKKIEVPYRLWLQGTKSGKEIAIEGLWTGEFLYDWELEHTIEELK